MNINGFTLLEIMMALTVGSLLTTVIYSVFISNSKAVALQMRKAEIQQNLRASIFIIEADIKRIGFNPMNLQEIHAPKIILADKGVLSFQADINENGRSFSSVAYSGGNITSATDPKEEITISLGSGDDDGDGVADSPPAKLARRTFNENGNPYHLTVAKNIEVLNFVYLNNNGVAVNGTASSMVYPVDDSLLSEIKKIQLTIVVRSSTERRDYVNSLIYLNAQGQEILSAQNDGYDRTLLTKTIHCRNLGLL